MDVKKTILKEDINIPINIGDEILGGKFKNKKITVKEIGKNEKGDITINGKPLMRFRIPKKNKKVMKENSKDDITYIRELIKEGLEEIFESETRTRYAVVTESYIYADSNEEAIKKSKIVANLIDSRIEELERTIVVSLHKQPFSDSTSTEINLDERQ